MREMSVRELRDGDIAVTLAGRILASFDGDIALGHPVLLPHREEAFLIAESILDSFPEIPLAAWMPCTWAW